MAAPGLVPGAVGVVGEGGGGESWGAVVGVASVGCGGGVGVGMVLECWWWEESSV